MQHHVQCLCATKSDVTRMHACDCTSLSMVQMSDMLVALAITADPSEPSQKRKKTKGLRAYVPCILTNSDDDYACIFIIPRD